MENQKVLWYTESAKRFEEALPMGNGRLGVMDYGNGSFLINEETLWSGTSKGSSHKVDHKVAILGHVRQLLFLNKIEEAEHMLRKELLGSWKETYLPCAKVHLTLDEKPLQADYRSLNLETAISEFTSGDVTLRTFVSKKSQCVIISIESTVQSLHTLAANIEPLLEQVCTYTLDDVCLVDGYCPSKVPSYDEYQQNIVYNAAVNSIKYSLALKHEKVDQHTHRIYLSVVTNYINYGNLSHESETQLSNRGVEVVLNASSVSYEELLQENVDEMKSLFNANYLDLPSNQHSHKATDLRRLLYREDPTDYALIGLYFHYGRFLLHQSSGDKTLPANLQGIWNEKVRAPWCSNFTTNINLQMNYWHADVCQLEDAFKALSQLLVGLASKPDSYAEKKYDAQGLLINHNLDGWFTRGPVKGSPSWAYWPMASVWLGIQLMEHLRYTTDIEEYHNSYPALKAIAQFANSWLIEDGAGNYQTCPSTSPENEYILEDGFIASISYSSTMDIMMMREFAKNYKTIVDKLDESNLLALELIKKAEQLPKIQIHPEGYLKEWQHNYKEKDIGHRHLSHLFGFFPGSAMFEEGEEYIEAGKKALFRRILDGGDFTSWHCTWVINLLARFEEKEYAKHYLDIMIGELTCPNLFSSHRRKMDGEELFQIDGNFGGTRAIAELIVQDYGDTIKLLPAIDVAIPSGCAYGLKLRHGHYIDLSWEEGKLVKATLTSSANETLQFVYQGRNKALDVRVGAVYTINF